MVIALIEELKKFTDLPVVTWDERLSTVAAQRVLLEADMSRQKRKRVVDKVAAILILQGYRGFFGIILLHHLPEIRKRSMLKLLLG